MGQQTRMKVTAASSQNHASVKKKLVSNTTIDICLIDFLSSKSQNILVYVVSPNVQQNNYTFHLSCLEFPNSYRVP